MKEFDLIKQLTASVPVNASIVVGPGDDCAVLDLGAADREWLFKTDAVVEGVHFTSSIEPERIGHKALARCVSDIAAMGGTPTVALVTIGLPRDYDAARVQAVYEGMNRLARRYDMAIAGGETTTNPDRIFISISMLGWVARGKAILRSGARVGDAIFVTGELGGSIGGRHLDFEPRVHEGQWLAQHFTINSMIDLSDGLAGDLRHILTASQVGAELLASAVPITRQAKLAARAESSAKPPLLAALTDGEDFELLFTVAGRSAVPLLDAWKKRFPKTRLSCIGKIVPGHGVLIRDKHGVRPLNVHGYVHFS